MPPVAEESCVDSLQAVEEGEGVRVEALGQLLVPRQIAQQGGLRAARPRDHPSPPPRHREGASHFDDTGTILFCPQVGAVRRAS